MLNIAIVGLGRLGKSHANILKKQIDNAQIIAAVSPMVTEQVFAVSELGLQKNAVYSSLDELLQSDLIHQIDAVMLVTPTSLHAEQSIQVLQAGKHLFVEKPLALSVADCERVVNTYAQTKLLYPKQIACVGFVRRFDESYLAAKKAIIAGEVGMPFYIRSQTCDKFDPSGFFIQFSSTSGGLILDCNVHDIDLARWFLQDKTGQSPKALDFYAIGSSNIHPELSAFDDVDNVTSTVTFAGGKFANFYASRTFAHGHETSTEVIAEKGKLLIGQGAAANRLVKSDENGVSFQALPDFFSRFEDAFAKQLQCFVDNCEGRIDDNYASLEDALEATRIGVELTKSLRKNLSLTVKE